ncbi:HD domain-containing phosphohydrolase [Candidatus Villigracilis affinis]|uniref:HD domain-containing phosphohydrolase n=2 Tax=Candidatus Villigracilis affinis TaxID=3140682 RepID=UPI002A1D8667|nr:transporter substrate-binding domain-containing protein [Anaerolineales bacterium]
MKMNIWGAIALACILASCSVTPITTNLPITSIRVAMDNNYPPYAFEDENGVMQGILVDQWTLWEKHTGVKVEIDGMHWEEALERTKNGEFDVIDTIFYTEERAESFDFTEPYAEITVRAYFPATLSGIANVGNLNGFQVAVKAGDANAEYLLAQGVTNLVYYNSYEEIVQAASRKDEAIFVMDEPPAIYFLQRYGILNDFSYSEPLYGGEFHRAVRKGNTEILALVNEGFSSISAVENQTINYRWFGRQYLKTLDRVIFYLGMGVLATLVIISLLAFFNRSLRIRVDTRTKELQEALLNLGISEARFRESIEYMPIPISIADNHGNILTVNEKFTEQYGYSIADMPTVSAWMTIAYPNPEYREMVIAQWAMDVSSAVQNKTATPLREYNITDKNGHLHVAEIIMHPVKQLWVASFVEITEHKNAERIIQESEKRYRTLFEDSPIPLLEEDFSAVKIYIDQLRASGIQDFRSYFKAHPDETVKCTNMVRVVDANAAAAKWYGSTTIETIKVEISQLVDPNGYNSFIEEVLFLIEGNDHYKLAVSRHTQEGAPIHLIITGSIAPGHEDSWSRVLISILDITESKQAGENLAEAYNTTLEGWAKALELRDKETEGHSRRVTETTLIIARAVGIKEEELMDVRRGTILHDIGKMAIPDEILRKQGPLTEAEREIVNQHPQVAYDLLAKIPYLKKALEIPYCHHEKWDGTGYPRGLKGEEIPLTARIFTIADVWDAVTNDRPYRKAWDRKTAADYLREETGKHFDPQIVHIFIELLNRGEI